MTRTLVLVFVLLLPAIAHAQSPRAPHARPTASVGIAFALVGLDTYGIAADVHAGADVTFGDRSNELTLGAGWTPYAMTGARLDLFALDAGWRWRPAPEVGFFTLLTLGLALGREALDVRLAQRHFEDVLVEPGVLASLAVGWTIFDYVDVQVGWRQALLATDRFETLGNFFASVGGRL